MHAALTQLVQTVCSNSLEERRDALLQVGLLLEKYSTNPDTLAYYDTILTAPLHQVALSLADQHALVLALVDCAQTGTIHPGILWALGKARREIGLAAVLAVLQAYGWPRDEVVAWEALIALDNHVLRSGHVEAIVEQTRLLDTYQVLSWLETINTTGSPRLQTLAAWILEKMITTRNGDAAI